MRTNVKITNRSNRIRHNVLSFSVAAILAIVGFLSIQPFLWIVLIFGYNFHTITFLIFLMIAGFVIGGPLFLFGLISLLVGKHRPSSTTELDIGRIRYTVETDRMERK